MIESPIGLLEYNWKIISDIWNNNTLRLVSIRIAKVINSGLLQSRIPY